MKKLIAFAALAALTGSVYAACGETTPVAKAAQVYTVKFNGKTTKGLRAKDGPASACGEAGAAGGIYRAPDKITIDGWMAFCDPTTCASLRGGTSDAAAYAFWATKPIKANIDGAALDFDGGEFPHRIGKAGKDAEAYGTFKGSLDMGGGSTWDLQTLYFAGLGKFNCKNGTWTSITGNFAGSPAASWYISNSECAQSSVWDCTTCSLVLVDGTPNTVAFGTWCVKYNAAASKKIITKNIYPTTPSYATVVEGSN